MYIKYLFQHAVEISPAVISKNYRLHKVTCQFTQLTV